MTTLWLIILALVSTWLAFALTLNPVLGSQMRRRQARISKGDHEPINRGINYIILLVSALTMAALAVALYATLAIDLALIAMSLIAYVLALFAYFILQRFAGPIRSNAMVNSHPIFYPFIMAICFASLISSTIIFGFWYLSFTSIAGWFVIGFLSAEISIRQYMVLLAKNGRTPDRQSAIFGVNQDQGRKSLIAGDRYPFP